MVRAAWERAWGLLKTRLQRPGHAPAQSPHGRCWCGTGCRGCSQECGAKLGVTLVLVCCIVLVAMTFDVSKLEGLLLWVKENKLQGSLLFLLLYMLAIVLMVPAMVMAMCAGAIFGAVAGALIVWVGSSVGQVMAFMVGRYLLRDFVLRYLTEAYPKWGAIDRALEREGWKLVTLLRLSPIAPWNVLNYALAVTAVPVASYALASSLAILPYLVMFVYLGSLARTLSDIFGGLAGPDTGTTILLGAVSGVLMVAIVWWTTQMAKKAIREALVDEADGPIADSASAEMDVLCMLRSGPGAADSAAGDPDDPETELCSLEGGDGLGPGPHRVQGHMGAGHIYARAETWSPRSGTTAAGSGVAATIRVVGGSGSAEPGGGGGGAGRRGEHEVQLTPLVPAKEVVITPRSDKRDGDAAGFATAGFGAAAVSLQQHVRGPAGPKLQHLVSPRAAAVAAR